jgi:hypothetical protein
MWILGFQVANSNLVWHWPSRDANIELLLEADSHGDISYCHWFNLMSDANLHDEEHLFTSLQRMCKWGWMMKQTGRGVQDYNIDEHSDSSRLYSHIIHLQLLQCGDSWWVPEKPWFISSVIVQMARDICIKTWLQTVLTCILQQLWACWWITLTHKRLDLFQQLTSLNLKCFFIWWLLFK